MEELLQHLTDAVRDNLEGIEEVVAPFLLRQNKSCKPLGDIMLSLLDTLPGENSVQKEDRFEAFQVALQKYECVLEYHARYIGWSLAHLAEQVPCDFDLHNVSDDELIDWNGAQALPQACEYALSIDGCIKSLTRQFTDEQNELLLRYYKKYVQYTKDECLTHILLGYILYNQIMAYSSPSYKPNDRFLFALCERVCSALKGRN